MTNEERKVEVKCECLTVMESFQKVQESVQKLQNVLKDDLYPRDTDNYKQVDEHIWLK